MGRPSKHKSAPLLPPLVESRRLEALYSYNILDTPRESVFDDITRIAATICGTPMASITLVDAERQWFKSEFNLGVRETPIKESICAHAILENDVLVVPDTMADGRFAKNPGVISGLKVKFYAAALIKTPDGLPIGTVCVLDTEPRTITESQVDMLRVLARQVTAQLELRMRLKSSDETSEHRARLLASGGYELQQPLFTAMLAVHAVMADVLPHQRKRLTLADESLERIKRSVNGMIAAASGKSTFTLNEFVDADVGTVLAFIRENFIRLAQRKNIRLRVRPTTLRVMSDPGQLETLIGNLVANALKYTGTDGNVLVGCRRCESRVDIHIIDTGIGMAGDTVEDLFQPFRQADVESDGPGLGLWIVRKTAEALGIVVLVKSSAGKGTHVTLRIPLKPPLKRTAEPVIQILSPEE
jgi:signal transduction histidine kinase